MTPTAGLLTAVIAAALDAPFAVFLSLVIGAMGLMMWGGVMAVSSQCPGNDERPLTRADKRELERYLQDANESALLHEHIMKCGEVTYANYGALVSEVRMRRKRQGLGQQ